MRDIEIIIGLLTAVVVMVTAARRLNVPYPIPLVLGGLALGFVPGLPRVRLDPNLIFLVFLPPLLYAESLTLSWRDFRANLRPIGLLAIGLVVTTTGIVAAVAHTLIPGLPWAAAFVLGAIVAPTDEVASAAIAERLSVPRRIITIIEGESLVNDAVSLVIFRLAVAAVGATSIGAFSAARAGGEFIVASVGGIGIGLAVGWAIGLLRRQMRPDPVVENTVSLLTPFAAYLPAESLGVSGVLAVVVVGLYLGRKGPRVITAETRLQAQAMWKMLDFLLNSLLFILVGFQLHPILARLSSVPFLTLLFDAALVSLTVIVARILWVFPATYLPRIVSRRLRERDPSPPWQWTTVISWTGIRGGISLAAALAIPLTVAGRIAFPQRDLLIFLTFAVILAILVLQGLSLPALIQRLGLKDDGTAEREEARARLAASRSALERLDTLARDANLPAEAVEDMRGHFTIRAKRFEARVQGNTDGGHEAHAAAVQRLRRDLVATERRAVVALRDEGAISDDVLQRVQHDLDLEEQRLEAPEDVGAED